MPSESGPFAVPATDAGEWSNDASVEATDAGEVPISDVAVDAGGPVEAASDLELFDMSAVDWLRHHSQSLFHTHFQLAVCEEHFPPGSAARAEVEEAVEYFNSLDGVDLHIEVISAPHLSVDEMYATDLRCEDAIARMDYVDESFPCHEREDGEWLDSFSMNTCHYTHWTEEGEGTWNSWGGSCFFNVAIDAYGRDHDEDPDARDYPRAANIAHELGHGFGMQHTDTWPEADRGLISTMQGNLNGLSAHDVAFLRYFYSDDSDENTIDLVPSPMHRRSENGSWRKVFFGPDHDPTGDDGVTNPTSLYVEGDDVFDCSTGAAPVFRFGVFNLGTASTSSVDAEVPLSAELVLVSSDDATEVSVREFALGEIDATMQGQWEGELSIQASALAEVDASYRWRLRLNADGRAGIDSAAIETEVFVASSAERCD